MSVPRERLDTVPITLAEANAFVERYHRHHAPVPEREMPLNLEAEQALLGAILINNRAYERVSEFLQPEHFADPVHGEIYDVAGQLIAKGQMANPVTMKNLFDQHEALGEVGGAQYLVKLAAAVVTSGSTTPGS